MRCVFFMLLKTGAAIPDKVWGAYTTRTRAAKPTNSGQMHMKQHNHLLDAYMLNTDHLMDACMWHTTI